MPVIVIVLIAMVSVQAKLDPPEGVTLPKKQVFKLRADACNNQVRSMDEAAALCAAAGAELTTKTNLQKFVDKFGMTECGLGRCGFLKGRVFEVFCEKNQAVKRCPDHPSERGLEGYDVYCFGKPPPVQGDKGCEEPTEAPIGERRIRKTYTDAPTEAPAEAPAPAGGIVEQTGPPYICATPPKYSYLDVYHSTCDLTKMVIGTIGTTIDESNEDMLGTCYNLCKEAAECEGIELSYGLAGHRYCVMLKDDCPTDQQMKRPNHVMFRKSDEPCGKNGYCPVKSEHYVCPNEVSSTTTMTKLENCQDKCSADDACVGINHYRSPGEGMMTTGDAICEILTQQCKADQLVKKAGYIYMNKVGKAQLCEDRLMGRNNYPEEPVLKPYCTKQGEHCTQGELKHTVDLNADKSLKNDGQKRNQCRLLCETDYKDDCDFFEVKNDWGTGSWECQIYKGPPCKGWTFDYVSGVQYFAEMDDNEIMMGYYCDMGFENAFMQY